MRVLKVTKYLLLGITFFALYANMQTVLADSKQSITQLPIGLTDPAIIKDLSEAAYIWSLPAEFMYRFTKYHELITAPINTLSYSSNPAAWNNAATNAGNSSALYINCELDLTHQDLVYTIPATNKTYIVNQFIDNFINTFAVLGTRTSPSSVSNSYLLVGPNSKYANKKIVRIKGFTYKVIASDTNSAEMLVRIGVNTLVPPEDPNSVSQIYTNVVQKFALNTLKQFQNNGNNPIFPSSYESYSPTQSQLTLSEKWQNTPTNAIAFFNQVGASLKNNPLPTIRTGLSGTKLENLPAYITPQAGINHIYLVPSFEQETTLAMFKPIGLTKNGFKIPKNWGAEQIAAMQQGFELGEAKIQSLLNGSTDESTNYWFYMNKNIGTFPNTIEGYQDRAVIVLAGGFSNIPLDAIYAQISTTNGTDTLDGNNTYSITFANPIPNDLALPVEGILPPLVNDNNGNPKGFWSLTLYQPDSTQAAAPFISQASVINTAYSSANITVLSVDSAAETITVVPPVGAPLVRSTPIFFGNNASQYGLVQGVPYYIASSPDPTGANLTFQVSTQWIQDLSSNGVPIQYSGNPGTIANLNSGADRLVYGMILPVSQLSSTQITSKQLVSNTDGSYTLWLSPTLPNGISPTNWIPTPSTQYLQSIYGTSQQFSTTILPMLRIYYPTPGGSPPSILPCPANANLNCPLSASYIISPLVKQ
jgi:hypothetical protein